ncbi:MAG: carboxylating nicotinate-nucleotide diphosphorylase [Prevotellaceae bacterium]|jgi:nicotinate-nucleotide pyrophosphorylase (carboxylating)|nr:carboxylating nicotinate-nucleotide diphosphorylase [Prevotellaceae bacterium]
MDIQNYIDDLLTLAIAEDIGNGDHTSLAVISPEAEGKMKLLVKEKGVIAGIEIAKQLFKRIDRRLEMEQLLKDGAQVQKGDIAFYVTGRERALLQAERLVLNIMQRMSGVATQTATYVKELKGLKTQVLDTRKTTPGMRVLDKLAVKTGGGGNHRMGLFDMILLKDNHVDFAGGIEQAIVKTREYLQRTGLNLAVEIEVRSLEDLKTVLRVGGVQRIMFDNFDLPTTKEAVVLVAGRYETESSGGITLENLRAYAECGVDFISVGALTHQIKSLDLSLKAV